MKTFLLVSVLLTSVLPYCAAQQHSTPTINNIPHPTFEAPIYYFPFYNGVQIIEVSYYEASLNYGRYLDQTLPWSGSSYSDAQLFSEPNGYILRDSNGTILKNYGVTELHKRKLEPPNHSVQQYHKEHLKRTAHPNYTGEFEEEIPRFLDVYHVMNKNGPSVMDTLGNIRLINHRQLSFDGHLRLCVDNSTGKRGLWDEDFEERVPAIYRRLQSFTNGYFVVQEDSFSIMDATGKMLNHQTFKGLKIVENPHPYLIYTNENGSGLINANLETITEHEYAWVDVIGRGMFIAYDSLSNGVLINQFGKEVSDYCNFQSKPYFLMDGFLRAPGRPKSTPEKRASGRSYYALFDSSGIQKTAFEYEAIGIVQDDISIATRNQHQGLLHTSGKEITPFKYDRMYATNSGHYVVEHQNKFGVIDAKGKTVIPIKYISINCGHEGIFNLQESATSVTILNVKTGKTIPHDYDNFWCFQNGVAKVEKNGKIGLMNEEGLEITGYQYDTITLTRGGIILVITNSKFGAIDQKGNVIVPLIYSGATIQIDGGVAFKSVEGGVVLNAE